MALVEMTKCEKHFPEGLYNSLENEVEPSEECHVSPIRIVVTTRALKGQFPFQIM